MSSYFRNAEGVIVVFSLTDYESYIEARRWTRKMRDANQDRDIPFILIGNKYDLCEENPICDERLVSTEDGVKLAAELGMQYIETSARTGHNVDLMLETIFDMAISYKQADYERER